MLTPHAPIEDDDEDLTTTGYGYGMFTGTFAGHAAYYHPGDNPGYRSFSAWLPDQAASLVVLANDDGVRVTDLLRELLRLPSSRNEIPRRRPGIRTRRSA